MEPDVSMTTVASSTLRNRERIETEWQGSYQFLHRSIHYHYTCHQTDQFQQQAFWLADPENKAFTFKVVQKTNYGQIVFTIIMGSR